MTPVDQTLLVERDFVGDCFRAVLASLLDLELRDVPGLVVHGEVKDEAGRVTRRDQEREASEWLASRGLQMCYVHPWEQRPEDHPQRYVMLEGRSPRGVNHVVVGDLAKPVEVREVAGVPRKHIHIAHDPHPSRSGIEYPAAAWEIVPIRGAA